ncbi:peptidoglycan-binding protein [Lusitaniella coriacea]|nr:peptidoglycan-binding protein [Lusitaniella coriacea]
MATRSETRELIMEPPNLSIEEEEFEPCEHYNQLEPDTAAAFTRSLPSGSMMVKQVSSCSTSVVNGLSKQIIDEMNAIVPGVLVTFDSFNVSIGPAVWPYLQQPAKEALGRAIADRGQTLSVNSAYRTIAQQLILYNHSLRRRCGISIAARPGRSNHQSGLAVDINDPQGWRPFLERQGWSWLGRKDPPHFNYVGGGTQDIRSLAVLAFQKLWNKNNLNSQITEDSAYGPQVESCLNKSPIEGFGATPPGGGSRTLRLSTPRMEGDDIREIQQALASAGFQLDLDGVYGSGTAAAVKEFQAKEGLEADGIFGPASRTKLLKPKL